MFGCWSRASVLASERNLARFSSEIASSGLRNLSATRRLRPTCSARKTKPMPPLPHSARTMNPGGAGTAAFGCPGESEHRGSGWCLISSISRNGPISRPDARCSGSSRSGGGGTHESLREVTGASVEATCLAGADVAPDLWGCGNAVTGAVASLSRFRTGCRPPKSDLAAQSSLAGRFRLDIDHLR